MTSGISITNVKCAPLVIYRYDEVHDEAQHGRPGREQLALAVTKADTTREQLLARAEALVPVLAERAAQTEKAARVPQETVDQLVESGLMRIATPVKWGGYGLDYDTAWEVATILGRGCGSTAWCYMVGQAHNWQMGLAPDDAQSEYFTTPDQISSSAPPGGTVESTGGGWSISGRWSFSSGVDNASWVLLSGFTREHGLVMLMVPKGDCRIEDDWVVSGLKGTGSKSVVVDEPTFVPGYRYTPFTGVPHPEARAAHDRPSYGAPFFSLISHTLVAPLVGMAQGMVEAFTERMLTKRTPGGQVQVELLAQQLRMADAAAAVDAGRALARANLAELIAGGDRGDEFTDLDRARFRRDHAFVAKLCVQAANRLFEGCGGSSIYDSNPLQRFHRDIHAGSHQIAVDWDMNAELYGRAQFGLEMPVGHW